MASTDASTTASSSIAGKNLLSVEQCVAAFKDSTAPTKFVDGSWHLAADRDGRSDYEKGPRIQGAVFFDIDAIATTGKEENPKGLPHMAPPKKLFAAAMDAMGITNKDHIIIYGTENNMFLSRAWYTFRNMGHDKDRVHMMQGSLKEWEENGGPIDTDPAKAITMEADALEDASPSYQATEATHFCDRNHVLNVIQEGPNANAIILDARPAARFYAEAPEPREGVRGGHMPGSFSVPFVDLLTPEDKTKFKSAEEMKAIFSNAGVDLSETAAKKKFIVSCGSGVTACALAVGLEQCGVNPEDIDVYDGSWTDWGTEEDTPVVTGREDN